ncbi:MAG: hypothetical protein ACFB2W_00685 [Leptolyngbyaceae cyanobacterium]
MGDLRFLLIMLNNPDILLSLVGVTGLISVAATALLNRDTVKGLTVGIGEKIDRLNSSISYVQGKLDGLERILSDGVVSPEEVEQIKDSATEIKSKIASIVNPGGDVA